MNQANLPSKLSIVLVENSQDESLYFTDIVKKKYDNIEVKVLTNSFEAIQWLQNNRAQALVIEEDAQPMNAAQTSDYLRQELEMEIPIFISSSKKSLKQNYILKPFTKDSLSSFFDLTPAESEYPLYSLNYLKEISGGNSEFIRDSVAIFKSSVQAQIKELEIASEENNDQKASEIAHSIKPSFEMMENKEGSEICNKLTYDLENYQLSLLVKELKIIFENILQQLENDFSPKK